MRIVRNIKLLFCLTVVIAMAGVSSAADGQGSRVSAQLDALVQKIDMDLYRQSEADLRALLDGIIAKYWPDKEGHELDLLFDTGGLTGIAAMWFRGYEMLGDEKYLQAGLDFADALLQTQRQDGLFPNWSVLRRKGKSEPRDDLPKPRFEDSYHFVQFALIVYAHKLSGKDKYLAAAKKYAEMVRSVQDPSENEVWQGPWPLYWYRRTKPLEGVQGICGYVLNDYATYDSMRTMIMAYFLTGEKKYIDRIRLLPAYIVKSNVGLGNVRGWRGQADSWNESAWARSFEGPLIDPRNFNRFAAPMLTYFYAVTGEDLYANMEHEGYNWLRSVELAAGGWAYKYTYDGREAYTGQYRNMLRNDYHIRHKVVLNGVERALSVMDDGGLDGLRQWYGHRPTKYTPKQYLQARIEAARRVTDEHREVKVVKGNFLEREIKIVKDDFLERVRQRPLNPERVSLGEKDGYIWIFHGKCRGWAAWQYVWDVRVALGKIDENTAAWGGRGLESAYPGVWFTPEWDAVNYWSTKVMEVENWLDIPLDPPVVHVESVKLEPESITLKSTETSEIRAVFTPSNATCKTGVWTCSSHIAWVQPHMLDRIDPSKVEPKYSREGKMMIHAGLLHRQRKCTITFTTTDGQHSATCKVTVDRD